MPGSGVTLKQVGIYGLSGVFALGVIGYGSPADAPETSSEFASAIIKAEPIKLASSDPELADKLVVEALRETLPNPEKTTPTQEENLITSDPEFSEVLTGGPVKQQKPLTKPSTNQNSYTKYASIERSVPRSPIPGTRELKPKTTSPQITKRRLFGTLELQFADERKIKAWSRVYDQFHRDARVIGYCLNGTGACNDPILAAWADQLRPLKSLPRYEQINRVNALANTQRYGSDRQLYGMGDYWASPREFLTRNGDCEDYALLKFASLMALGHSPQNMRVVVGKLRTGQPHAFLAVGQGTTEVVLDNRTNTVSDATHRNDYIPKYSMNLTARWSHVVPRAVAT